MNELILSIRYFIKKTAEILEEIIIKTLINNLSAKTEMLLNKKRPHLPWS